MPHRSSVVLLARVDDPIQQQTRTTRTVVVQVEHEAGEALSKIIEMALELASPVDEWLRY